MPDTFKSMVSFLGVAGGAEATMAHGLNLYANGLKPDEIKPGSRNFELVAATTTTITVRNNGPTTADCDFLCEAWHPIERLFDQPPDDDPFGQHLTPQPFVQNQSSSATAAVGSIVFGTGQDGAADFDGINTFAFASLSGSTYTLTRDVFVSSAHIHAGITVATAGFRAFCNGTTTVDAGGVIANDGHAASGVTAGTVSALGTTGAGVAGGNGHTGTGTGTNGSSIQSVNTLTDASATGGAGGAGGAQAGGNGGAYSSASTNGGANFLVPMLTGFLFTQQSGGGSASINIIGGGAGGGGGGSDNAGVNGGGGGGGGGVLVWHSFRMINNGSLRTKGGNGADAAGAGGNGGGGGGGGGGTILSICGSRSGTGTYDVPGGTGGAKIGGSGVAGSDGATGHKNLQYFPV